MLPRIYIFDIQQWWELNCDEFIWNEVELRGKRVSDTRDSIFYSERESD